MRQRRNGGASLNARVDLWTLGKLGSACMCLLRATWWQERGACPAASAGQAGRQGGQAALTCGHPLPPKWRVLLWWLPPPHHPPRLPLLVMRHCFPQRPDQPLHRCRRRQRGGASARTGTRTARRSAPCRTRRTDTPCGQAGPREPASACSFAQCCLPLTRPPPPLLWLLVFPAACLLACCIVCKG